MKSTLIRGRGFKYDRQCYEIDQELRNFSCWLHHVSSVQIETHWISDCKRDMTAQFQLGRKYHIVDGAESDTQKVIFRYKNMSKRMMTLRN
ncbi:hypothetical protein AXN58_18070 [Salmonella enterica subsp. enterica]|uniref:Uncharacterized protein n=1 Tax=Salmonella enterica I TaxID=59201 RepID=A0A5U4KQU3_SALET|nr:hypothetical protein ELZ77_06765 [Salmonella enterica subsp. enterica serovar Stanleyville]EBP9980426.1 hypothetical protein [Salmonella enterica subsp. enterica]EBQ5257732.1 hypothetical protein [Salmonella enterica]EDH6255287.1 hypothetical protein [Salmonella enterica subsp. enterica serovar Amoutive]EDU9621140.1 hypothetical protein [Salmonella enterica subsp. enterica serovar Haifa]EEI9129249.1 hypothetical protein [Salmonella enterica subsp. enterica serovar Miami]